METEARGADPRRCESCNQDNPASARFCAKCGASFAPPPSCPACKTELGKEARFCPGCGLKVVGLRPIREAVTPSVASAAPAANAPIAATPAPATSSDDAARAEMKALADSLPKAVPSGRGSNLVGNVLLFVAVLAVFLVATYVWNKDKEKTVSPFEGGPPPMKAAQNQPAQQEQQQQAAPAPAGSLIQGTVNVDPALKASAPSGTVFIILRMAGMPDRGPPVAVVKLDDPSYPAKFEVGPRDMMNQQMPWEGPFDIYARLDADGNAMTKAPGDLSVNAPKPGIKPGQTDVEIVLDKRL